MAHTVSTTQPPLGALGDEWYNPTTNKLFKLVAVGGTSVQWIDYSPVVLNPGNNIIIAANNTITSNVSGGGGITINSVVTALIETTTISATAPTATFNYDVSTQSVLYITGNAVNNWTLNVRGSAGTTLNAIMAVGNSITIAHAQAVNSITYYQSAFTIDGTSVTPKWATGTAPTNSTGTGIDMYVYTIMKTASATYTVLASRTNYT